MKASETKVIAIQPKQGCWEKHLKILKSEQLYQFYNNYKIDKLTGDIEKNYDLPKKFFSQESHFPISISAVVGKNGTGKSTLVELLFKAINNIALYSGSMQSELKKIPGLFVDLYIETDRFYKISVTPNAIKVYQYNAKGRQVGMKDFGSIDLRRFFYTVAINYSHYAYNSAEFGEDSVWLEKLFHKNDGYQIPLVINPMRTKGDIDINNENHLVKSRLITTILLPARNQDFSFRRLTENYTATSLKLTIEKSVIEKVIYEIHDVKNNITEMVSLSNLNVDQELVLKTMNRVYPFNYKAKSTIRNLAYNYLIYKMVNIALKYDGYKQYFEKNEKRFVESDLLIFCKELIYDGSHITFKLMQTLNFLRYEHIDFNNGILQLNDLSREISKITSTRSARRKTEIELIPPPIFKVEILLRNELEEKDHIEFETLSSGQKQMIYSVSSLLYHLVNLNSVTRTSKRRIAYSYINIVFEEIELYFHPEMQRLYINTIINGINNLSLDRLKGINIMFITHSPFILSDIPKSNILFLNAKGLPDPIADRFDTFGGNIHTLLSHSFFLENGLIGEFAKRKIEKSIKQLNSSDQLNKISKDDLKKTIQLIGEPFLRNKLLDMFYSKFPNDLDKQAEIQTLQSRLNILLNG